MAGWVKVVTSAEPPVTRSLTTNSLTSTPDSVPRKVINAGPEARSPVTLTFPANAGMNSNAACTSTAVDVTFKSNEGTSSNFNEKIPLIGAPVISSFCTSFPSAVK